jgi:tetratricopeptide (TPR) repeat protein
MSTDPVSGAPAGAERRFGRYEIREEISRGGMGIVYKAWDTILGRDVALKVLRGDPDSSPESVRRFWREAKTIAALRHPSIVPIHDIGEENGTHYFTMDFVDGETLQALAAAGRLDTRAALEITAKVADAIHHAHEQGVIHRDLKPRNIMVSRGGHPLVMDFGLAKPVEADLRITQSGVTMGTPPYMSPEQARGVWDEVGPRADVYSLGATLYELLCGRPPFDGRTGTEILIKVVEEDPPRPRTLNRALPAAVETILLKAMAKDPERRYESARAMGDDLRRVLAGKAILAHPPYGRLHRAARRVRRIVIGNLELVLPALAGVVLTLTVFGAVEFYARQDLRNRTPPYTPVYRDGSAEPGAETIGPEWKALQGTIARDREGGQSRLVLAPDQETSRCVVLNQGEKFATYGGSLRIRFEAAVPKEHSGPPPEIGCFLYALPGDPLGTGYRFRWGEAFAGRRVLLKNGRPVRTAPGGGVEPGLTLFGNPRYRVAMELDRDVVRVNVNGAMILEFKDDFPEEIDRGKGCAWGLTAFGSELVVTGIEADRPGVPKVSSPVDFADELYVAGDWLRARSYYARVLESVGEGEDAARFARYRMALCDLRLATPGGDPAGAPALDALRKFALAPPDSLHARAARLAVARRGAAADPAGALALLRPVIEDARFEDRANAAALLCLEEGERRALEAMRLAESARAGPSERKDETLARAGRLEGEAFRFLGLAEKGSAGDPFLGARCALLQGDLYRSRGNLGMARRDWGKGAREFTGAPLEAAACAFREVRSLREAGDDPGAAAVLERLRGDLPDRPTLDAVILLERGETWRKAGRFDRAKEAYGEVLSLRRGAAQDPDLQAWALLGAALAEAERSLSGPAEERKPETLFQPWRDLGRMHRTTRIGMGTRLWAGLRGEWDVAALYSGKDYPPAAGGPLLGATGRLSSLAPDPAAPGTASSPQRPFGILGAAGSGDGKAEALAASLADGELAASAPNPFLLYWLGLGFEIRGRTDRARACYELCAKADSRDGPGALAQARLKAMGEKGR